jgi:ATP-dependent DNA helicase RecG
MDRLKQLLEVMARPLAFAERGNVAIKDLGGFISRQVTDALGQTVRSSPIEAELLHLVHLFSDYEQLSVALRSRRVAEARRVLQRLEQLMEGRAGAPSKRNYRLWEYPIQFVKGVGPRKAEALARCGIRTLEDAVWYLPWRYEDRSQLRAIGSLIPGDTVMIEGTVKSSTLTVTNYRHRKLVEVRIFDATGEITLIWFNQPYLADSFRVGQRLVLYGQVRPKQGRWTQLQIENPVFELLDTHASSTRDLVHMGRIVPVYHGHETKSRIMLSDRLRTMMKAVVDQYAHDVVDPLPPAIQQRRMLLSFGNAIQAVHFPQAGSDLELLNRGRTPGHRRFAFEDFLLLELALGQKREQVNKEIRRLRYDFTSSLPGRLLSSLPFELTAAQVRVLEDISRDMSSNHPMNRLIQGDVGSGKTVVALLAMLTAVGSGHQAALMAPTEILAEQHCVTLSRLLEPLGLAPVLLSGGRGDKRRKATLTATANGSAQIVVGTHALIQQNVMFHRLALVVVDEQHKFGVMQRAVLKDKGYTADVLVMTATPIPRTLALTVYGDLDVSVIDMLPPGRQPIRTYVFAESQRARMYGLIEEELAKGRQAYVVFPLVEESEKVDLQAAITGAERLQREVFSQWTVGLVHGRMRPEAKDRIMSAFKEGKVQVLVATTVIEVGIDVANASVMVVEHADRFGLAQLHQLRGRVGRGMHQSFCLLMAPNRPTEEARRRLEALAKSHDGFVIAEEDLAIRGPGEFFGTRQWGPNDLRVANLIRDAKILEEAREEASALLRHDPELVKPEHVELKAALMRRWGHKLALGKVS